MSKRETFTKEYLVDFNGAAAARRAGYSPNSARQTAHELLTKPDVQTEIIEATQERFAKLEISQDSILLEYSTIAFNRKDNETPHETAVRLKALEFLYKHVSKKPQEKQNSPCNIDRVFSVGSGKR